MNITDKEQTFLVRGLDKATTADEADTCAKNLFKELRERGAESYQILAQLDAGEDYMPYESEGTPEFEEARAYQDYVGHENWKRQNEARAQGVPFQWCHITFEEFRKWYDANKDASGKVPRPRDQKPDSWSQKPAGDGTKPEGGTAPQGSDGPGNGHVGGSRASQGFPKPDPGTNASARPGAEMSPAKTLFLLVASLAIAFLCFHGIFPSLIFGFLFAIPMIGSRWFRRFVGLIGLILVGFFAYILASGLNDHTKSQAPKLKVSEQLGVQVPGAAAQTQPTTSSSTPLPPPPAPAPELATQSAGSLAGGDVGASQTLVPRAELVTPEPAPRAELVKLPARAGAFELDPAYRERLHHKLERQLQTGVAQSME